MDTMQALLQATETLLTGDATLQAAMGGAVRIRYDRAMQDEVPPYIVVDYSAEPDTELWAMEEATIVFDLFSKSANPQQALSMRDRVILLLDQLWMTITEMGDAVRWRKLIDQNIPSADASERDWWRIEVAFAVRYFKKAEVTAINAR